MLTSLRTSAPISALRTKAELLGNEEFDLLVIGGGATGSGVAVDAASRGLKVALVERDDFSSGKYALFGLRARTYHRLGDLRHLVQVD
jgi:glycerol-3-phosphate dehydrogenase